MRGSLSALIACLAVSGASAQGFGNFTSNVLAYYGKLYNGTNSVLVWDEAWRLVNIPMLGLTDCFVNIGIHYGTTIVSAGGSGLIGGAGAGGSTHHTCYVGNFLPPTCITQHWAANVGATFGPGASPMASGISGWTSFTTSYGNAFVGFVVESVYEVEGVTGTMVEGSKIEFDNYHFLENGGKFEDFANALWLWRSSGKQVEQHPDNKNLTFLEVSFQPVLALLGTKSLKFRFMFVNAFALLDSATPGQMNTSLTTRSMEMSMEVLSWTFKPFTAPSTSDDHKLAVDLRFFSSMAERVTYGSNGYSVVSTTDSSLTSAKKRAGTLVTDGFETDLPSEGAFSVWQTSGDWQKTPEDVTFFTIAHRGMQGGSVQPYAIKQLRFDTTTGKSVSEMKNALYDDYVGALPLDEAVKTVWNVGQFYFNKLFDGKPLQYTTTVYQFKIVATAVNTPTMKVVGVSMGVGPYINPYQQSSVPPSGSPTCSDGVRNQGETAIDCGGPRCPLCESCDNGIKDQNEQLMDCGGPNCPPCDPSLIAAESSADKIPFWVWIIVAVVVFLLCVVALCLVFFLVVAGGKKKKQNNNTQSTFRTSKHDLQYGTTHGTEMTGGRQSHRSGRSRGGTHTSGGTMHSEARKPSRAHSRAELPTW